MSQEFTDEQELLRDSMVNLMESEEWESYFRQCDDEGKFPDRYYRALRETGLFDILIPEEQGGLGGDFVTFVAAWEALLEHGGSAAPIWAALLPYETLRDGTPEQVAKIRKSLDEYPTVPVCSAFTEPSGGSDLGSYSTTYERKNGKVYLNGSKTFVTDGVDAEYAVVLARDAETGEKHTRWLVPLKEGRKGLEVSQLHGKLGLRTNTLAEFFFTDLELDESDMLGNEGQAFEDVKKDFNIERLVQPIYHYGYALYAYEEAMRYANQREAFGQTIGRFELMQEKIAVMASNLAASRALLYETARKLDEGSLGPAEAGICKYFIQSHCFTTLDEAMQIMGGVGIVESSRISRCWRDVRADKIAGGTAEMVALAAARAELKRFR